MSRVLLLAVSLMALASPSSAADEERSEGLRADADACLARYRA